MKKLFSSIVICLMLLLVFTFPVFAASPGASPGDLAPNVTQVMVIGFVATIVAQVVKLIVAAKWGQKLDRKVITIGLFVIAVILAYIWAAPSLPTFPATIDDPGAYSLLVVGFIGQIVVLASTVIGFAKLIYDLLLAKVFDSLGWGSEKIDKIIYLK